MIHDYSHVNFKDKVSIRYHLSDLLNNNRINVFINLQNKKQNNITSISNIYFSSKWIERELQEFNNINFVSLIDSRRLLTDYTYSLNNKNMNNYSSYNILTQELYKGLLHWLYLFSFLYLIILLSFILYNKSLFNLILLSEVVIIILILIMLTTAIYLNLYYLVGFSVLILVLGGLELSLNLLLLVINCEK